MSNRTSDQVRSAPSMNWLSDGVPIVLEERSGIRRINEPVRIGIPFPRGVVVEKSGLVLLDQRNATVPLQVEVLAYWPDRSMKWALLDFQAHVEPNQVIEYKLRHRSTANEEWECQNLLSVRQTPGRIEVNTGKGKFIVNTQVFKPFESVTIDEVDVLDQTASRLVFLDDTGQPYEAKITAVHVNTCGPVRATIDIAGTLNSHDRPSYAVFTSLLSFFANSSLVELKFTIRNPRAAEHLGGLWDLGDKGSIYFKDLSLEIGLSSRLMKWSGWATHLKSSLQYTSGSDVKIWQNSSGGSYWKSSNHMNRFGKVTTLFPGHRVTIDGIDVASGARATPIVTISDGARSISGAIEGFWQNFPKAIGARQGTLSVGLFPNLVIDAHELQGGEQKTHTVVLQFDSGSVGEMELGWVYDRLTPHTTPEWYANSKAVQYLVPRRGHSRYSSCLAKAHQVIDRAVDGPNSFFDRREIIDEYGWRHFGDIYADHEAVRHQEGAPLVAHYNNQYDLIYGAFIQYLNSADIRWFQLMNDLAKHVIDIDIYHTQDDRPAYNGGLFWHTEHYCNAGTATHRTFSKANVGTRDPGSCGGGPSNEHNYTTGLLHYYFLTGDSQAMEAMLGLADWVINMDTRSNTLLSFLDRRPTGLSSSTAGRGYHGPGRGAGNSINALIDAYEVSEQARYLAKAECLIRRCIHPRDAIEERGLQDVEHRWSYTVFLQVLGKYLDFKAERNQLDDMYRYAHASLLHYAQWMLQNEVPYKAVLDRVEIPTETWPAQDIRKSNVFKYAAKYSCGSLRSVFLEKSEFFFDACITDLLGFKTYALTRPTVLLTTNVYMHAYFHENPDEAGLQSQARQDFGQPIPFKPQFNELYEVKDRLRAAFAFLKSLQRRIGSGYSNVGVSLGGGCG